MTKRLPPDSLNVHAAIGRGAEAKATEIFHGAPHWMKPVALAALYRFRPDLGETSDPALHDAHMRAWPVDTNYFNRLCRLMKAYGVGSQNGLD